MASDIGGVATPARYRNFFSTGFPVAPDNIVSIDMCGFPRPTQDPYFSSVALLVHGDAANGSTSLKDFSPSPKSLVSNSGAGTSTAYSAFGGSSLLFDGIDDFWTFGASVDFSFLTTTSESFTVEMFVRPTSYSTYRCLVQHGDNSANLPTFTFLIDATTGVLDVSIGGSGGSFGGSGSTQVPLNAFSHVAATYDATSSTLRTFLRGVVEKTSVKGAGTFTSPSSAPRLGRYVNGAFPFVGNIDEIRITRGVARYTANFTPPVRAFPDF